MRVHIVCQNYKADRIIPRMARALANGLGWSVSAGMDRVCDVVYLSGYFEAVRLRPWPEAPTAAYFTHLEEQPPNGPKAKLFKRVAKQVQLRVATCTLYGDLLCQAGPTVVAAAPLERERFVIGKRRGRGNRAPTVGLSGYTYSNHRKGEDLIRAVLKTGVGRRVEWRASGRGWPVPTKRYKWAEMPRFYQGLDVLVVPSRVEGIPMPPLEALACGVRVVIPEGVGMLDELPKLPGIYRYRRGDAKGLAKALERAAFGKEAVEREALRAATKPYSVEQWCADLRRGFEEVFGEGATTRVARTEEEEVSTRVLRPSPPASLPQAGEGGGKRGIYVVAFGDPARKCALRLMKSIKAHMPDVLVALCADRKIGLEDVLIKQPDSDIGGRRAKIRAYELVPAEWEAVLYLDADTKVVAPIYRFFEWIEDGWEFVICKDPHLMDTMHSFERKGNQVELREIEKKVYTLHTLQFNGGVWAFGRNARVAAFFKRWLAQWEKYAGRDQGALIRALYADPLRVLVLGNEWNTFPKYSKGIETAGLMHYPGDARRWRGRIPGRIDSPAAWAKVKEFEKRRQQQRRRRGKR